MKAVIVSAFAPFDHAVYAEVPDCQPESGEVVIDVVAADVNFPDLLVMEGRYQIKPPLPFSPGKAATGIVSALGEGVSGLSIGDRVIVFAEYGLYAEKARVPVAMCLPLPAAIPFEAAAASALTYQTAYFALKDRAGFRAGDRVLVLGASGGVGLAAVQLAKALRAGSVIGCARDAEGAVLAHEAGCDHVIVLDTPDIAANPRDAFREAVHNVTDGQGVDIVIDPVGGDLTGIAIRALDWCGRLVVIGFAAGDIPTVKANYLLVKNIAVSGLQWSDYRDRTPERVVAAQADIFDLWQAGKLSPQVSARFDLSEFKLALKLLNEGRAKGKIILTVQN